jgi:2'-hydroxyisoflavone reductase
VLEAARAAGDADTSFVWADPEFVLGLGEQREAWFPMWHPHLPGFHTYDAGKATAAGLRPRPFGETIDDTLTWDRERGAPPLAAGMTAEKERELLEAWRART